MKFLCSNVFSWEDYDESESYFTYEMTRQNENFYFLREYECYKGEDKDKYYKSNERMLSKYEPYILFEAYWGDDGFPADYPYISFKEENGWGMESMNLGNEKDFFWFCWRLCTRGNVGVLSNLTEYGYRLDYFEDYGGDNFAFIQKEMKEKYGETILCPESPKLLNQLCKVGVYLYWGDHDGDVHYLGYYFEDGREYAVAVNAKTGEFYELDEGNDEDYRDGVVKKGTATIGGKEYVLLNIDNASMRVVSSPEGEFVREMLDGVNVCVRYDVDRGELIKKCKKEGK